MVTFGDKSQFAIEVTSQLRELATVKIWVDGRAFGDDDQYSVLRSLQLDAEMFLSMSAQRVMPEKAKASPEVLRDWFLETATRVPESFDDARALGAFIESVCLFAYAPEGLTSVRVVVVCGLEMCSVTAWDMVSDGLAHARIRAGELERIVGDFAALQRQ